MLSKQLGCVNLKRGGESRHGVGRSSQRLVHFLYKEMGGGGGDWISLAQRENYQIDVEGVVDVARHLLGVQLDGLFGGSTKPTLGVEFKLIGKLVIHFYSPTS